MQSTAVWSVGGLCIVDQPYVRPRLRLRILLGDMNSHETGVWLESSFLGEVMVSSEEDSSPSAEDAFPVKTDGSKVSSSRCCDSMLSLLTKAVKYYGEGRG